MVEFNEFMKDGWSYPKNNCGGSVDPEVIEQSVNKYFEKNPPSAVDETQIRSVVNSYVEENISSFKGEKGDPGQNGAPGEKGEPGQDGAPGADGITPHIGENGNWFIGDRDTGQPAVGSGGSVVESVTECTFYNEEKYIACVGAEFNIYFDNICTTTNNQNVYFNVTVTSGNANVTGFDDCLRINPTTDMVGDSAIKVTALRKDNGNILADTSFTVSVIAKTTLDNNVTLMCIGDSLTNAKWQNTMLNLVTSNLELYGTCGEIPGLHEGRVSWNAHHYCLSSNYNTLINPFYNANKSGISKFDFAYYMQNNPQFSAVNIVNITLGRNFGYEVEEVDYIKYMVDSIKEYNPDIIVTLGMAYHLGVDYSRKDIPYVTKNLRETAYRFNERMHEVFDSYEKVFLVPQYVGIDNLYDHPYTTPNTSGRNTVKKRDPIISDKIHFDSWGYQKMADAYYPYFNYAVKLYPPTVTPSEVDKTEFQTALNEAKTNLSSATVSVDGTDVFPNAYWVTQEVYDEYLNVINSATIVYNNASVTETEVLEEISKLNTAKETYNSAKELGTKEVTDEDVIANFPKLSVNTTKVLIQNTETGEFTALGTQCVSHDEIAYNQYGGKLIIDFNCSVSANKTANIAYKTSSDGLTWGNGTAKNWQDYWITTIPYASYRIVWRNLD